MQRQHPPSPTPPHIALNAQLLKLGNNYRSAGITNYIYQLVRHLPQVSDYRYSVWTGEGAAEFTGMTRYRTHLPTHRPPVRILWEQLVQPFEILRRKPDLLHGLAFVLPVATTTPGIITIFDLSFFHVPETFNRVNRLYLQTMSRVSAKRAVHICAIAEHGRQDIVKILGVTPDKVSVVYPGLDPRFATPPTASEIAEFRQRKGLPDRYVLFQGTLEPRKNVPMLVRAYAEARKQVPDVHLVLAGGKGWGFDEIFAEVERLGLQTHVHFPGFVPSEEQRLWYAAAELFVYPSRYEGFGLPPLEAMASGTPVITSNAASLSEVVGDAGTMIDPNDEAALTAAMMTLLRDPALRAERQHLGLRQAATFRWETSACTQAEVYRTALGQVA